MRFLTEGVHLTGRVRVADARDGVVFARRRDGEEIAFDGKDAAETPATLEYELGVADLTDADRPALAHELEAHFRVEREFLG